MTGARADRYASLGAVAGAAARGDAEGVRGAVGAALAAGCSADEVREALRMVHLFCGFPRALDALAAAASASLPPAAPDAAQEDPATFGARGRALFDRVYGPDAAKVAERLRSLDPELTAWVLHDAYGRVLARPALPAAERERLAVVFLAAQGLRNQLPGHVRGALRCGATEEQVKASLAAATPWIDPADLGLARTALRRGLEQG